MNCPHKIDVAVYVLDALESPETDWMRKHLSECPDCHLDYDELRGLPALLRALTLADVEDIVAPAELPQESCEALAGRASTRRRRRTRNPAVLVADGLVHSPLPPVAASTTGTATDPHAGVIAPSGQRLAGLPPPA